MREPHPGLSPSWVFFYYQRLFRFFMGPIDTYTQLPYDEFKNN